MTDDGGGSNHVAGGVPAIRFRSRPGDRPPLECEVPVANDTTTSGAAAISASVDWVVPDTSWSVGPEKALSSPQAPAKITPALTGASLSSRHTGTPEKALARDPVPASTDQVAAPPLPIRPTTRHRRAGHRRRRVAVIVLAGVVVGLGSASFALHGGTSVQNSGADTTSMNPPGAGGPVGSHSSTSHNGTSSGSGAPVAAGDVSTTDSEAPATGAGGKKSTASSTSGGSSQTAGKAAGTKSQRAETVLQSGNATPDSTSNQAATGSSSAGPSASTPSTPQAVAVTPAATGTPAPPVAGPPAPTVTSTPAPSTPPAAPLVAVTPWTFSWTPTTTTTTTTAPRRLEGEPTDEGYGRSVGTTDPTGGAGWLPRCPWKRFL